MNLLTAKRQNTTIFAYGVTGAGKTHVSGIHSVKWYL